MAVEIPPGLAVQARIGPAWASWVDRLPRLAADLLDEWSLTPVGRALHGYASLVLPVHTAEGVRAALKLAFDGDDESLHEALALQHWGGDGAVVLLRADPRRRAMLLEWLSTTDLTSLPAEQACEVVAGLYPRLHQPAFPQLRPVASFLDGWLDSLERLGPGGPLPPRLVAQALSLGRAFVADPTSAGRVVHGDLHDENVLAGDRQPWLAIDPKPMSGDPHYEPGPMLWNRWDEAVESGDARAAVRRRFHTLVDVGGLDEDRARDWVVVRSVVNANWSIEDALRAGRPLDAEERAWVTVCVTVAKAVQG